MLGEVIREERYRERVLAQYREALDRGIRAVPAVVMPGRLPVAGAVEVDGGSHSPESRIREVFHESAGRGEP